MSDYYDPVRHLGDPVAHQKMYDFERDMIRAKNPLNQDFTFFYDSLPVTVPANSTKDMERYFFRRFIENMIGHIYNQVTEEKFAKAEEAFQRTHPDVIDDPYLINDKIWLKLPRADNREFQQKVYNDCFVGVVSKFGSNRVVRQVQNNGQLDTNTPLFQQLINAEKRLIDDVIDEEVSSSIPPEPVATEPLIPQEAPLG